MAAGSVPPGCNRITVAERLGAILLVGASLVVGIYPKVLINLILPALGSPAFEALRKAGSP